MQKELDDKQTPGELKPVLQISTVSSGRWDSKMFNDCARGMVLLLRQVLGVTCKVIMHARRNLGRDAVYEMEIYTDGEYLRASDILSSYFSGWDNCLECSKTGHIIKRE